ncbi:MAG: hypothetical protein KDC68_07840 [Gelidibacter sp.]|nr:hypothetical protein [Gelidibacter sp.]
MKTKWYLSALILVLTFLGICHNQISLPNQEVLVQFNTKEVTAEQSQNAIAAIKQQLQAFGVDNIQVREESNGSLKISYHSAIAVENIKKTLSDDEALALDFTALNHHKKNSKYPSKKQSKNYNLDVYELHKHTDNSNSAGTYVINQKQDYDRFFNPNIGLHTTEIDFSKTNNVVTSSHKLNKNSVFLIDNTSYIIPEVRAGPSTILNS